jgi:vacuolar-type H+-ATPase subunit F/Vma7
MNFGKLRMQFPTVEQAEAYLAELKTSVETVEGETTSFVVIDDRSLQEAKDARITAVQTEAKALLVTIPLSNAEDAMSAYEAIQARFNTAQAAIEAAETNAAVDAVVF